jgi:hypothetical protein
MTQYQIILLQPQPPPNLVSNLPRRNGRPAAGHSGRPKMGEQTKCRPLTTQICYTNPWQEEVVESQTPTRVRSKPTGRTTTAEVTGDSVE